MPVHLTVQYFLKYRVLGLMVEHRDKLLEQLVADLVKCRALDQLHDGIVVQVL